MKGPINLKVYSIHYNWNKTNVRKISFWQNKWYKKCPLFSFASSFWCSYFKWCSRFTCLKMLVGFSFFNSVFFYKNSYFCSIKSMDSLTLKRHDSFQNQNNRKSTHTFASRPLIFKLQQNFLKFNNVCMIWISPITDLVKNILNLEDSKF